MQDCALGQAKHTQISNFTVAANRILAQMEEKRSRKRERMLVSKSRTDTTLGTRNDKFPIDAFS